MVYWKGSTTDQPIARPSFNYCRSAGNPKPATDEFSLSVHVDATQLDTKWHLHYKMTFTCTLSNVKKWPIFHFIPDSVHSLCSENWKGNQGDDFLFFGGRERGRERSLQRPPWCTTRSPRPPTSASVPARLQTYWCYDPKKHALMHILIGINSQKIGQDTPRYKKTLRQSLAHLFMAWPYITLKLPCIDLPCQSREKAKEIVATRNTSTKSHLRHFTHPQPILF